MGKRSGFTRNPRDFYATPLEGVRPLVPHLVPGTTYIEPFAGDGALVRHLSPYARCVLASDIEPLAQGIYQADYRDPFVPAEATHVISNPPWSRNRDGTGILHEAISYFRVRRPTWFLFDAGWAYSKQAAPFLEYCEKIVAVGRLSWMGNDTGGKDDAAWYLFRREKQETRFYARLDLPVKRRKLKGATLTSEVEDETDL